MKSLFRSKFFLLTFSIFLVLGGVLLSQSRERFFDTASLDHKEIRLTIFFPSVGTIKSLVELKNQGFLSLEQLTVIGVYHEKEHTDYQKSREFVKENSLKWFKFHEISAPLSKDVLFRENPLTPEIAIIFKKSDGIIFFGGADIPPEIYGEKTNLLTHIYTPFRHYLELSSVFYLLGGLQDDSFKGFLDSEPEFPILGICLGCQSLNVGTGGTLTQDIWSEKYGKKYFEDVAGLFRENWHTNPLARLYPEEELFPYNMHPIKLMEKGKFCSDLDFKKEDTPYILSAHHQMVEKLGKGIKVAATSLDGKVVEAIDHEKFPNVLGVQFHPEFPILWDYEKRFRSTLQDREERSLRTILDENPPSFDFHKRIWSWFSQRLLEYHKRR
ncbi:MAG: gamma-glutamyl-gamma-aminobutyrate hydrolase family protein [Candidatus Aminicenantaceae bacterium]